MTTNRFPPLPLLKKSVLRFAKSDFQGFVKKLQILEQSVLLGTPHTSNLRLIANIDVQLTNANDSV